LHGKGERCTEKKCTKSWLHIDSPAPLDTHTNGAVRRFFRLPGRGCIAAASPTLNAPDDTLAVESVTGFIRKGINVFDLEFERNLFDLRKSKLVEIEKLG
jgi:hypothetical protein